MRDRFVWIGSALYALVFFMLGAWKYAVHGNFVDFGIFVQTAASIFGCACNAVEGSHYAFHSSPILVLAGAVLYLWHSPLALIALQAIACALVAPPIAALVGARTDLRTARISALVVWLYPALAGLAFVDFHENVFAPAAVVWMVWCFDTGRLRWAFVCAMLAVAVKEDQAIFIALACAWVAVRFWGTMAARYALAGAIVAAYVAYEFFAVTQPHAALLAHWAPTRFYAWSAADIPTLLRSGLLGRLGFIVLAFAPLAFLPFRSRLLWFAVAPLAEVLLSRMPTTYTLGTHYAGAWIGFVLVAFAFAVRALGAQKRVIALRVALVLCTLELLVANPMHLGMALRPYQPRDAQLDAVLKSLPHQRAIATQEEAYTHLALDNPRATVLPDDPAAPLPACWVLLDADFPKSPRLVEYGATIRSLLARHRLRVVQRDGGITVYRCVVPAPTGDS
ncbi:MAG: DUF2079 domain-containing protein [Vulcanimicrobiaceae bacterium]